LGFYSKSKPAIMAGLFFYLSSPVFFWLIST
jgi:hypothetical protein